MRKTEVLSTGICLPKQSIKSSVFDQRLNKPDGWMESACGIAVRPVASTDETQEGMATSAAKMALAQAGLEPDELDLILFAAAVGRQPIPATAPLIKGLLGIKRKQVAAYDVNATCLSTLVSMDIADLHIRAGRAKHVLVVSSEIASRALPWGDDPATAGLFGDGAGALVLVASDNPSGLSLNSFAMETWPEGYDDCALAAGGTRFDLIKDREQFEENSVFRMNGHNLFKLNRKQLPDFVHSLLAASGWAVDDVDVVVPHQASPLALST